MCNQIGQEPLRPNFALLK